MRHLDGESHRVSQGISIRSAYGRIVYLLQGAQLWHRKFSTASTCSAEHQLLFGILCMHRKRDAGGASYMRGKDLPPGIERSACTAEFRLGRGPQRLRDLHTLHDYYVLGYALVQQACGKIATEASRSLHHISLTHAPEHVVLFLGPNSGSSLPPHMPERAVRTSLDA